VDALKRVADLVGTHAGIAGRVLEQPVREVHLANGAL
jgi:hypothetical protein